MYKSVIGVALSCLVVGSAPAFAQASPPAGQPASPTKVSSADKKSISKACSDQANAKGLHGKERKTFRSECRRAGGRPM